MKKTILTLVGALSVAGAFTTPVLAQPYGAAPPPSYHADRGRGWEIDRRLRWLQDRINQGRANGSLDRREFRRVETELNRIDRDASLARRAGGGRLDDRARFDLQARLDRLNDQIHWLRRNDVRRPW